MPKKLLFAHSLKKVGWILFLPAFLLMILLSVNSQLLEWNGKVFAIFSKTLFQDQVSFNFMEVNLLPTLVGICFIAGGILVAFSEVKNEDEYISNLRLSSLLWAVYVHYALLFLAFIFIYNWPFLTVMVYNMFTILVIFIVLFHFILYRSSKQPVNEE